MKTFKFKKPINNAEYVETVSVVVNPEDIPASSVTVSADVFKNSEGNKYYNTQIKTVCYGMHSACISFGTSIDANTLIKALLKLLEAS